MVKLWVTEFGELGPIGEVRRAAKNLSCPCLSQSFGFPEGWSWCSSLVDVLGRLDL